MDNLGLGFAADFFNEVLGLANQTLDPTIDVLTQGLGLGFPATPPAPQQSLLRPLKPQATSVGGFATPSTGTPAASGLRLNIAPPDNAALGGLAVDKSSNDAFVRSITPFARQVEAETGIPAAIMVAMATNETGYGRFAAGNNYFGIKGANPRTGASFTSPTWEDYGQGRVNIVDRFRAYENPADSFRDFVQFLNDNSRYQRALSVRQDPVQFINALKAAGYATDPIYPQKILQIARTWGLL